jgi:CRISPR-associated exonuclease Cas4
MNEEEYLMISGIQHFSFCKRQWALIHMENLWKENRYTVEGDIVHKKVDNPNIKENRKDLSIIRAMRLVSHKLKFAGIADIVEIVYKNKAKKDVDYINIVEYKRGTIKDSEVDELQLCLEVMALEEMIDINITESYIYYDQIKKRLKVQITEELREKVKQMTVEMYKIYTSKKTPVIKETKKCRNCSLYNLCNPQIFEKPASKYMKKHWEEA